MPYLNASGITQLVLPPLYPRHASSVVCPSGNTFKRRTFTFGFGTGSESVEVRLKPEFHSVLAWRKQGDGENKASWHEIDLNDVKTVEPKGDQDHDARLVWGAFPLRWNLFSPRALVRNMFPRVHFFSELRVQEQFYVGRWTYVMRSSRFRY